MVLLLLFPYADARISQRERRNSVRGEDAMTGRTRRELLATVGTGFAVLTVHTVWGQLSPAEARARGVALRTLSATEGNTLEALGDILLPGAAAAGIALYVDDQLGSSTPLLILRYLDFPGPLLDVYRQGLLALDQLGRARHGLPFHLLSPAQQEALVREMAQSNPPEWSGPPAPLFYFVTRNDAVDVCYGTEEGFARLAIPYLAHIPPPRSW